MERLVNTSQAAKLLNLSVQGVHYRIKKGQLKSKKENGRVYVYIDEDKIPPIPSSSSSTSQEHFDTIIKLKDEQIEQFEQTLKMIIKQYKREIKRLEKNQTQMLEVFNREIQLLQQAFNEMRTVYQVEHKKESVAQMHFMSVNDFFVLMKKHALSDQQIKKLILLRIKKGDARFIFDKNTKELHIYKSEFKDLLQ
ncbi:MAG: DUF3972 domain-containing protein [Campylobacterota bacterium]|nr:DUF3972 domain-containing protein [Campylobacterota bacterium]